MHSTTASDLAYETMYDDDELVDTNQTMPWFDPNYLASGKEEVHISSLYRKLSGKINK